MSFEEFLYPNEIIKWAEGATSDVLLLKFKHTWKIICILLGSFFIFIALFYPIGFQLFIAITVPTVLLYFLISKKYNAYLRAVRGKTQYIITNYRVIEFDAYNNKVTSAHISEIVSLLEKTSKNSMTVYFMGKSSSFFRGRARVIFFDIKTWNTGKTVLNL